MNTPRQGGYVNPLVISNIATGVVAVILAGVMIWALANYFDQKNNVDNKIEAAVTAAKKSQSDQDEKNFLEREKAPTREFVGPDDLGRVSFQYPKTWSVYVATRSSSSSSYEAYLNPLVIPGTSDSQPYATRVVIESRSYDSVVKSFQRQIEEGKLKSSPVTVGGLTGIRLDGTFSASRQGSAVIFKIRDKTLTVASDAQTFRADFDNTIIKTLTFIP